MATDDQRTRTIAWLQRTLAALERIERVEHLQAAPGGLVPRVHADVLDDCVGELWQELGGNQEAPRYLYGEEHLQRVTPPGSPRPITVASLDRLLAQTRAVLAALDACADPVDTVSGQA